MAYSTQQGLQKEAANTVLAGPTTGAADFPTIRALVAADIPFGPGGGGGVNSQTANYPAVSGDSGKLITMNGSSLTLTLPNPAPSATWWIAVENTNASSLTISRNSLTIDGAASNLTLTQNQGVFIYTDGTNYFTSRGMGSGGGGSLTLETNGTPNGSQTLFNAIAGSNMTITDNGSGGITFASTGGGGGGTEPVNAQTGTSYAVQNSDSTKLVTFSNTASVAVTIAQAGSGGNFASGWYADFQNRNAGVVTITPATSTIDGKTFITLSQFQGVRICSDGSNYFTVRGGAMQAYAGTVGPDAPPATLGTLDDEFNGTFDLSRWTWANQGTALVSNSNSLAVMSDPSPASVSTNNRFLSQPTPGTPWQVAAKLTGLMPFGQAAASGPRGGIFVGDGTKYIVHTWFWASPSDLHVLIQEWATAGSSGATANVFQASFDPAIQYLSIKDDGTTLIFYVSMDGVNWWDVYEQTISGGFLGTVSQVGLYLRPDYNASSGTNANPRLATAWASFNWFRRLS